MRTPRASAAGERELLATMPVFLRPPARPSAPQSLSLPALVFPEGYLQHHACIRRMYLLTPSSMRSLFIRYLVMSVSIWASTMGDYPLLASPCTGVTRDPAHAQSTP
ncbi:unnamed protein product [Ectocarpus sp. 8 AP-2014]